MTRGRRWTREEIVLLQEMVEKGMNADEITKSGKFPGRTYDAIRMQIDRCAIVQQKEKINVEQIRAVDVISLEDVLKRFTDAFRKICETEKLEKLELDRFRIIFSAAKDYAPLLVQYERLSMVEEEIARLRKMVEEVQTQVHSAAELDKRRDTQDAFRETTGNSQAEPSGVLKESSGSQTLPLSDEASS